MVLWALKDLASKQHARRATLRAKTLIEHASMLAPDMLLGFLIRLGQDFKGHVATHTLLAQPWARGTGMGIDPNLAAYFGLEAVLRHLLEVDGNLEKQHENGAFPLLFAAQEGHLGCVAALLEKGAAVNAIKDTNGNFPLLMAAQNGHTEIVAALLEKGAAVNMINDTNGTFPLLMAAQNGHTEIVAALLEKGAAVDMIDDTNGTFPLLMAAQEGHTEIVAALLEKGAAVDMINNTNGTFPLLMAAQNGHTEIVAALLENGAAVDMINDTNGTFPLLMATHRGHLDITLLLLRRGAHPDQIHGGAGLSAVDVAVMSENDKIIQVFCDHLNLSPEALRDRSSKAISEYSDRTLNSQGSKIEDQIADLHASLAHQDGWPVPFALIAEWRVPDEEETKQALRAFILTAQKGRAPETRPLDIRVAQLPCYPGLKLFDIVLPVDPSRHACLAILFAGDGFVTLDGTAGPIHALNSMRDTPLDLSSAELASDYLKFFCAYVHDGPDGPFRIVECAADLGDQSPQNTIEDSVIPIAFSGKDGESYMLEAMVNYANTLFGCWSCHGLMPLL
jgi:ankyrin repeat protein